MLRSENQAAAAQAAGTLWNLCVEDDTNKQRVGETGAIPHLIALLHAPDPFTQSQAVGALSECSLGQVMHTSLRSLLRTRTRGICSGIGLRGK